MLKNASRLAVFAVIAALVVTMALDSTSGQDAQGQAGPRRAKQARDAQQADPPTDPEEALRLRVLEAAKNYREFGRVDDEARWAPYLCRSPMRPEARVSQSGDDETHGGQKLYFMFAKDRAAYANVGVEKVPDIWKERTKTQAEQIIVKESWHPKETDGPIPIARRYWLTEEEQKQVARYENEETKGTLPFARQGDKTYYAHEKNALFLMLRADEANSYEMDHSVNGWVFATTTPDGEEITALGKIESCVNCHQDAPHNGLFGLPGDFAR